MKESINQSQKNLDKLEKIIGTKNFNEVVQCFAGKTLYFPRSMMILEKHQNIKAEYQNGTSIDSLAFKYAYTENHIRQIVKSEGNVSKQMKLRQIIGEKVKKIGLLFR